MYVLIEADGHDRRKTVDDGQETNDPTGGDWQETVEDGLGWVSPLKYACAQSLT